MEAEKNHAYSPFSALHVLLTVRVEKIKLCPRQWKGGKDLKGGGFDI
jgi:hypothetical protein